jgi:uncharacterized protein (TIGR04255 family)
MREDVLAAWVHVETVLQPEAINRIGLRYINLINKETAQDSPGTWFIANDYIPSGFLHSRPGFLLREEIHLDSENILIITFGDPRPEATQGNGAIIFDIDRITERELSTSQEVLMQEIERLHTDVWNVFSSAKGEKLEALLSGRPE